MSSVPRHRRRFHLLRRDTRPRASPAFSAAASVTSPAVLGEQASSREYIAQIQLGDLEGRNQGQGGGGEWRKFARGRWLAGELGSEAALDEDRLRRGGSPQLSHAVSPPRSGSRGKRGSEIERRRGRQPSEGLVVLPTASCFPAVSPDPLLKSKVRSSEHPRFHSLLEEVPQEVPRHQQVQTDNCRQPRTKACPPYRCQSEDFLPQEISK